MPPQIMYLSRLQRMVLGTLAIASLLIAFSLLLWAGLPQRSDYSGFVIEDSIYVAAEIGEMAPPIDAETLSGKIWHLSDFRGDSVIINFWATWCAPCAIEMPELQVLYDEMGVEVVGVNIGEARPLIASWVDTYQLSFDIVLDPQQTIYHDYRVIGQPSTYVVNPDGIITHIYYGPSTADILKTAIATHQPNG